MKKSPEADEDGDGAGEDPEGLGEDGGAEDLDRGVAGEGGEAVELLVEDELGDAADEDRGADGDDDERDDGGAAGGLDGELVEGDADGGGGGDGDQRGEREGQAGHVGEDGDHAAEHHELALGEVHHVGGVVDDGEAEGDQRVDRADGHAGQEELHEFGHGVELQRKGWGRPG